jgi:hypothetical protein
MTYGYQVEKAQTRQGRKGVKIAVLGALASILLWFSVSIAGKPIIAAGSFSPLYLAVISAPPILVASLAIYELRKNRIR